MIPGYSQLEKLPTSCPPAPRPGRDGETGHQYLRLAAAREMEKPPTLRSWAPVPVAGCGLGDREATHPAVLGPSTCGWLWPGRQRSRPPCSPGHQHLRLAVAWETEKPPTLRSWAPAPAAGCGLGDREATHPADLGTSNCGWLWPGRQRSRSPCGPGASTCSWLQHGRWRIRPPCSPGHQHLWLAVAWETKKLPTLQSWAPALAAAAQAKPPVHHPLRLQPAWVSMADQRERSPDPGCLWSAGGGNPGYQVGILLHYSTLATVLWVGVTARNIYKQVTRKAKRCQDPDEAASATQTDAQVRINSNNKKPALEMYFLKLQTKQLFYLIGGGIPIIVCGITAAANIKNYGSRPSAPYCWMAWEPSLGAFYGPASFIAFVNCMYFLSIFIQLKRHPERKYELKEPAEEQQRLAANENGEVAQQDSMSLSLTSTSALENEHTFQAQLLGAGLTLLLYVALWMFGALAVALDYPLDLVFSFFFGATCLSLSAFLVVHHCVNREDVRLAWIMTCCPGRSSYSVQVNVQPPNSSGTNGEAPKCTNSSAESSLHQQDAAPQLDNSLTEHSVDNDIKMHVAPLEVQFRANVHPGRHHKNRSKGHRASRLTVLREYAYDVPTSVEGSVQNGLPKIQPAQQDSSDAASTLPKSSRNGEKTAPGGSRREALRKPAAVELESQQKSYGLNLATQNGPVKSSGQEGPSLGRTPPALACLLHTLATAKQTVLGAACNRAFLLPSHRGEGQAGRAGSYLQATLPCSRVAAAMAKQAMLGAASSLLSVSMEAMRLICILTPDWLVGIVKMEGQEPYVTRLMTM
ncbi:hypothetical protein QTO34_008489 [Cnephaeus nilssonii]|uniref:Adhesion G protein-coupled receptor A3 n=1 Tax=Cnephaeus nilssonii TaxID=3371016 RepID=A0AA40LU51_CNENI|nr:hypothetical protein QTO34_008489 [Eptesicus nilssonii]